MSRRHIAALLSIAAMAITLAGCGSSTSPVQRYRQQIDNAQANFGTALQGEVSSISKTSSHASDVASMQKIAGSLRQLAATINALKVPKTSLKPLNQQLVSDINATAAAVSGSAGEDAASFTQQLQVGLTNLQSTINNINAIN